MQTQGPGWLVYVIYYGDGRVDRGSSGPAPNKWKDDDGDGIPNGDEVAPPPPPVDPNPPTTQPLPDADGDGFPDSVEDDFGTNPNDPQSNPATNYPGGPGWTPTVGDEGTDDGAASPSTQPSAEDISSAEAELNAVLNQLYGQLRAMGLDATPYQVHGDIPITKTVSFLGKSYTVNFGMEATDWVRLVIRNLLLVGWVLYFIGLIAKTLRQY